MIRSQWGVEGGEGDGGGGGRAGGRAWSNVVRNGGETEEEKKRRADNMRKSFQVKLELEGNRKVLGKGKIFTLMKDKINDNEPGIIYQDEIGKLLSLSQVNKEDVVGLKQNEFRKGQWEVLLKDDAKVDVNILNNVIEKENMKMSVGSFGHVEEVFMIYGLPLSNDVDGLKAKLQEAIEPFVNKIVSIEPSKHVNSATLDIFKGKLNGNWHVVVEPKRGVGVPNFIVVDQLERAQARVSYKKKYNERLDMCSDCFREGHHKMSAECQGIRKWEEYVEEFLAKWNEEQSRNREGRGNSNVLPSRREVMNQELRLEKEKNQEMDKKVSEIEEELKSLKEKEKKMEEKVVMLEEEKKALNEKVISLEIDLAERQEEMDQLNESVKMVEGNQDFLEVIDKVNEDLNIEKDIQSKIEVDLANLSAKDGSSTDVLVNVEEEVVPDGEILSKGGGLLAKTVNDKRKDISPISDTSKRTKSAKLPSQGMKVWVWENNDKFQWTVQSRKDKVPNGGCFNCKNVNGIRKSINFNEVEWEEILVANPASIEPIPEDPDGTTLESLGARGGVAKGGPEPFVLPPPLPPLPSRQSFVTSTPLPQKNMTSKVDEFF